MRKSVVSFALLLCASSARAQTADPLLARPLIVPHEKVEVTVHGTYTNWTSASFVVGTSQTLTGETGTVGIDYGIAQDAQVGAALALPVNPGFSFGSVLANFGLGLAPGVAFRVDGGYDRVGFNGDGTDGIDHINMFFGGFGLPLKLPLGPNLAFVSGRTGAAQFGHFNNLGDRGIALYAGVSRLSELACDVLVFNTADKNSGSSIGINLPAGLLVQADPHFAITLQAGYSVAIGLPSSGSAVALHFVPIGLEALVTPTRALDLGARLSFDGYVGASGGNGNQEPGFFDMRAVMFWIRFRS